MYICEICNNEFENLEDIEILNGHHICNKCNEDQYVCCVDCDSLVKQEEACYIDGDYYCEDCTCFCCHCNETTRVNDSYNYHGDYICENCYDNDFFTCERCGEIENYEDGYRFDDNYYCEYCYSEALADCGIHSYGYKPCCNFLHEENEATLRKNNLHIGIELEIQGSDLVGFCNEINSEYDFDDGNFYLKVDGSLSDNGIEIVSQPMTYKYITENKDWNFCYKQIHNYDMSDTIGCGLHFHLDREYLTAKDIQMIDYIVNTFSDFFETVGGRKYDYYCQKRDKRIDDWGKATDSRYSAVNLNNSNTVELRFCKSTYDYNTFIQRVRMIFAIVEFAKRYKYKFKDIINWHYDCFCEKFNKIYKEKFGVDIDFSLD
jgi:hypothetical protein